MMDWQARAWSVLRVVFHWPVQSSMEWLADACFGASLQDVHLCICLCGYLQVLERLLQDTCSAAFLCWYFRVFQKLQFPGHQVRKGFVQDKCFAGFL